MRLHRDKIAANAAGMNLRLTGNEAWLTRLYADFPLGDVAASKPLLTGDLTLRQEEAGSVLVTGQLSYAPQVSCGRCAQSIPWPLSIEVQARYLPENINTPPRELNLSRSELDAYYLEANEVDLEQLVNDMVQTALPTNLVPPLDAGESCTLCHVVATGGQVYSSAPGSAKPSPFAQLKAVKIPQ